MNPTCARKRRCSGLCGRGALLVVAAAALLLSGCGYSTSTLLRKDIRTVHVPVFENRTWRRGLEVDLTRAIIEELKLHTHLRIAPKQEADSTLEGELLDFEQFTVRKTGEDMIVLRRAGATVRFRWRDNLTLSDIVPSQTVRETETFAVARAEPLESRLFQEVAQRIVERMEEEW